MFNGDEEFHSIVNVHNSVLKDLIEEQIIEKLESMEANALYDGIEIT